MNQPLSEADRQARRAAGAFLHELLRREGPQREIWIKMAKSSRTPLGRRIRIPRDGVSKVAVCLVLQREKGGTPREIKDRVGRALSGKILEEDTLEDFITHFRIEGDSLRQLRGLFDGQT